jgi:hypothetical protein
VLAKKVVALPVLRWPDGSGNETAAAVRTDIAQDDLKAVGTKRTFIGKDARFALDRWQRFVVVLAGWPEFQHGDSFNVQCLTQRSILVECTERGETILIA